MKLGGGSKELNCIFTNQYLPVGKREKYEQF